MRSIALLISATVVGNAALRVTAPGVRPLIPEPAHAVAESTVVIQRGTRVRIELQNALSTETARAGDAPLTACDERRLSCDLRPICATSARLGDDRLFIELRFQRILAGTIFTLLSGAMT